MSTNSLYNILIKPFYKNYKHSDDEKHSDYIGKIERSVTCIK
jgi:hypothetical protein